MVWRKPRWLMEVGREEESWKVLQATRNGDVEDEAKGIKKLMTFQLEDLPRTTVGLCFP